MGMLGSGSVGDARCQPIAGVLKQEFEIGNPERAPLLVTKTLLFGGVGSGLLNAGTAGGSPVFRAIDKASGKVVHQMELPSGTSGVPMTYLVNERQFIVLAIGGRGHPAELVALAVP